MIFSRYKYLLPGILVLAAISMRWIFPEADPVWWLNIEDLHDEAWWAENARRKILFHTWMWDEYAGALASGPLAALWHWLSFKTFGISFFSLRLIAIIPSTLILLLVWLKSPFKSQNQNASLALLCGSSAFYALSKVGYLELMLILLLLIICACAKGKHWSFGIVSGFLMTAGLLFKGSFIFMLMPLIVWLWLESETKRTLILGLATFSITSLAVFLCYFLPNHAIFLPYFDAFSSNYLPSNYLYDPRGWIARLIWLPEKEWVSSPFACWMIIYFLLKINRGNIPSFKSSAFGLFILIIAFALLSDFSNRRLAPLTVLLPLIVFEKRDFHLNTFGKLFLGFILCLPSIAWIAPVFPPGDLGLMIQITFLIALTFAILISGIYLGIKKLRNVDISNWILRTGILIWSLSSIHYSTLKWMQFFNVTYWALMTISLCILILLAWIIIFPNTREQFKQSFWIPIAIFQFLVILITFVFPTFSLRKTAKQIAQMVRYEERITGPNNAVELAFLSSGKTTMFPTNDTTHSFNLYIGYLSNDHTLVDVTMFSDKIIKPRNEITYSLFPLIHKSKSEAYIVYCKTAFEKH
jgi:hypothetical protein